MRSRHTATGSIASIDEQENVRGGGEKEGGNDRDSTLKNMGELVPATCRCCWQQNLRVVAQKEHERADAC
jgi:hypothetical protein